MHEVDLKLFVSEEIASKLPFSIVMLLPLTTEEQEQMAAGFVRMDENLQMIIRSLRALEKVTGNATPEEVARTANQIVQRSVDTYRVLDWVRVVLGSSIRVDQKPGEETLQ